MSEAKTPAFQPIESWWFNINNETWILGGQGDRAYILEENAHLHFENDEWTMDDVGAELIDGFRPAGTAAAIVAYLNEHGVPWMQSSWSSTPPTSGDMLARHKVQGLLDEVHKRTVELTADGPNWRAELPSTGFLSTETQSITRYYDKNDIARLATEGWEFRPLTDVFDEPNTHQMSKEKGTDDTDNPPFVYCWNHARVHKTGWCNAGNETKIGIWADDLDMAIAQGKRLAAAFIRPLKKPQ